MIDDCTDDLEDRIRRYAERHDADAPGVIGAIDALDPSDLEDVRTLLEGDDGLNQHTGEDTGDVLVKGAEPVTQSDENDPVDEGENLSVEKSRNGNTGDGEAIGESDDESGDLDNPDKHSNLRSYITGEEDTAADTVEDTDTDENHGKEGGISPATPWFDVDFSTFGRGVYPPELDEQKKWMGAVGKQAFSPWGDRDHPEADPTQDARWKWGLEENHADGPTVDKWLAKDPRITGRAFIQLESDPYAFVDGDDVRDPDTGDVHPAFLAILSHLGPGPADISTSGAGVHVHYKGELPIDGKTQATFEIDTEPWGANDTPPTVELYAAKRLAVTTGEHVDGTPLEIQEWDHDALRSILEANGYTDRPTVDHDTDRDRPELDTYTPTATTGEETTDDVRDVLKAVDRLTPRDLPLSTRQTGEERGSGWTLWNPSYRASESGESLHLTPEADVFHDHKEGEAFGVLSLFAAEERIITDPWDRLEGANWWEAVDTAREAGAPIPEFIRSADADPVAVLPNTSTERIESNGWYWRHAAKRAFEEDTDPMDVARERTTETIAEAMTTGGRTLVEALPTLGKSYGSVLAAARTGIPTAILTTRGHKEQYDQIAEWCDEHGLTYRKLPAFTHDCETANGDHGEEWAERVRGWYNRGATPKQIHKYAEDVLDRPLPCQADDRTCTYAAKWAALEAAPDAEEPVDVLIGHYTHAHKRKVTAGRAVCIDEFPGGAYETTLSGEHELAGAVSTYLDRTPQVPFDDYTDLLEHRRDDAKRADALAFLVDDLEPDALQAFDGRQGHTYAPLAVFTLLAADDLGNGREIATFPESDRKGVFDREANRVHILTPPDLDPTRSVLALDGTPTPEMWELAIGERLNHRRVLDDTERIEYLEDVLGLQIVRTTDAVKPYASGNYVNVKQDMALLEAIADRHGEAPGVISSAAALDAYKAEEKLAFDPEDGTVEHGPADRVKWYGNVLGSNEFKAKRVGAVLGSNHYGDGFIKKWGAYAEKAVERNDEYGADLSYGSFGDRVLTHMREHDTLQAAMRFGRDGNGVSCTSIRTRSPSGFRRPARGGFSIPGATE